MGGSRGNSISSHSLVSVYIKKAKGRALEQRKCILVCKGNSLLFFFWIVKASALRFSFKINKEPITRSKWKNSKGRTNRRRNLQQRTQGQRRQIWGKEEKNIEKVSWPYSESLRSCSSRKGVLEPIQSCTLVMSRANWAIRCVALLLSLGLKWNSLPFIAEGKKKSML